MKKLVLMLALAVGLAAGLPAAFAHEPAEETPPAEEQGKVVRQFHGVVVSVDAAAGTIQAKTRPPRGGQRGRGGPGGRRGQGGQGGQNGRRPEGQQPQAGASRNRRGRAREVTFVANSSTRILRRGQEATLADLEKGDHLLVLVVVERRTKPADAVKTPAWAIVADRRGRRPRPPREQDEDEDDQGEDDEGGPGSDDGPDDL